MATTSPLPDIAGLDGSALAERLQGDAVLARSILRHFAETQHRAAEGLPQQVQHDAIAAFRRAHDLKGALGNVGADALWAQTRLLCDALSAEPPDLPAARAAARLLENGLPRLCDAILRELPPSAPTQTPSAPPAPRPAPRPAPSAATQDAQTADTFSQRLRDLADWLRRGRAREAKQAVRELRALPTAGAEQRLLDDLAWLVSRYRLGEALRLLEQRDNG